ncbi:MULTISPECIES: MFS transporter [unclassified Streptomyces]|uniref:MFS transporter n=1 Tax=unclassified Streptomyces TaxID=2593676 RepID=UPI00278BD408|nr:MULTISPECIES: MFS transporter [unclassified Streptomyces]
MTAHAASQAAAGTGTGDGDGDGAANAKAKVSAKDWWIIGLLLAFFTLNFADKAAIGLAAPDLEKDLGLTAAQYGLMSSAFFWLFAAGAVVLALFFRRIGWRWSAAGLMVAWVASMAPLTVPTTVGVVIASRMVLGFFEGPAHALCQSVVADRFPSERRAFAGAVVNAGSSVGPLVATPVLTWVIVTWTWHAAFVVLVVVGAVWAVLWLVVTRREPGTRSRGSAPDPAPQAPAGLDRDIDVPLTSLLRTGSFWGLALLSFAGYLISSLKVSWLPSFLHDGMGYSRGTVGLLATLPYGLAIVVLLTAGLVSGRMLKAGRSAWAARGLLTMGYLCFAGVAMIAFTQVPPGGLQLALVVAAFSINSVAFSVAFAGAADFLPRRHRPGFFGCVIAAYSVAGIVAPWLLGVIVDAADTVSQGYADGFLVVGITICVFAVAGGLLLNPARSRAALLAETARRGAAAVEVTR